MIRRQAYVFLVTMAESYFDDTLRFILSRNPEPGRKAGKKTYGPNNPPQAIWRIEEIFDRIGIPMFAGAPAEARYETYMVYLKRHCLVHENGRVGDKLIEDWKRFEETCPYSVGHQIEISEKELERGAYAIAQVVQTLEKHIVSGSAS